MLYKFKMIYDLRVLGHIQLPMQWLLCKDAAINGEGSG